MCGRYSLTARPDTLTQAFQLAECPPLIPRFNIAPSQMVVAVRVLPGSTTRGCALLRWGLTPPWAEAPHTGINMVNARAETASERPAFRAAFRQRRCLVLADGFYEWERSARHAQPYYIRLRDGQPFAFAGLWERWEARDGKTTESCTLLTTQPNDLLRPIHHRMPVILNPRHYQHWLDPDLRTVETLKPLLRPYPPEELMLYPVSLRINNPRYDDEHCREPLAERSEAGLQAATLSDRPPRS